jgi:hypothetical protein
MATAIANEKTKAFRVQISDVDFYNFLISIGVTPAKSKTIREVKIPRDYFLDFLRGSFDCRTSFGEKLDPKADKFLLVLILLLFLYCMRYYTLMHKRFRQGGSLSH